MQIRDKDFNIIAEYERAPVHKVRVTSYRTKYINRKEKPAMKIGVLEFPQ